MLGRSLIQLLSQRDTSRKYMAKLQTTQKNKTLLKSHATMVQNNSTKFNSCAGPWLCGIPKAHCFSVFFVHMFSSSVRWLDLGVPVGSGLRPEV